MTTIDLRTPNRPPPPPLGLRPLFTLRMSARRWPFALRAAICTGAPLLLEWAAADLTAGLTATLGAFTALYGADRPYLNRAGLLATIACGFALAVWLGAATATLASPWPALVVVALIAAVASLICNALQFGPPGAYMFVLVCAAGTFIGEHNVEANRLALLTLAGGSVSWIVCMSGALLRPRGPEVAAVEAAGKSVGNYIGAFGTAQEDAARHTAAAALHLAWVTLISYQPTFLRPSAALRRLRALNRELHVLFAQVLSTPRGETPPSSFTDHAQRLRLQARDFSGAPVDEEAPMPFGRFGALQALREALTLGSPTFVTAIRVATATFIAGAVAVTFGLERAYWAMAAAALMLHQGLNWPRTVQRGLERTLGTWAGLATAALILAMKPTGLMLAVTLMVLQFLIEMLVVCNYAIAVAFITPAALLIASGAHVVTDVESLLWMRGVDTTLGSIVALAVYKILPRQSHVATVSQSLISTLTAAEAVIEALAAGPATGVSARLARRNLQHQAFFLDQTCDESVQASIRARDEAESFWPAVVATQRLAYRILAQGWGIDQAIVSDGVGPEYPLSNDGAWTREAISTVITAIRLGEPLSFTSSPRGILASEIEALRVALSTALRKKD